MSFVCNTLQGIPLTWTNFVGRPNSCCWGGGRLGWEEGGRHLSRGHQLPPGWKSFTHCAISCFLPTSHQPSLWFWYYLYMNLVCEEKLKISKITEAELNVAWHEWAIQVEQGTLFELILASSYLDIKVGIYSTCILTPPTTSTRSLLSIYLHIHQGPFPTPFIFTLVPPLGPLGPHLQGPSQQDQRWVFIIPYC